MRRGRNKRVNVYLDDEFAFSLEADVAVQEGLRVDQELTPERVEEIASSNNYRRCYNAAALILTYRPRSEPELRNKLLEKGYPDASIDQVLSRMKEQGLVNDTTFAEFWKETGTPSVPAVNG